MVPFFGTGLRYCSVQTYQNCIGLWIVYQHVFCDAECRSCRISVFFELGYHRATTLVTPFFSNHILEIRFWSKLNLKIRQCFDVVAANFSAIVDHQGLRRAPDQKVGKQKAGEVISHRALNLEPAEISFRPTNSLLPGAWIGSTVDGRATGWEFYASMCLRLAEEAASEDGTTPAPNLGDVRVYKVGHRWETGSLCWAVLVSTPAGSSRCQYGFLEGWNQ